MAGRKEIRSKPVAKKNNSYVHTMKIILTYIHNMTVIVNKSASCGNCEGCIRPDCGTCLNCKDKKKFGGPGRKKQACKTKTCVKMSEKG